MRIWIRKPALRIYEKLDIKGFDILVENDRKEIFVIVNLRWEKWKLTEK
jgi:hypothetical protein